MNIENYISKLLTVMTTANTGNPKADGELRAYGFLLADMRREFTDSVSTMAVDGVTFFVNPKWALTRTDRDNLFTLCHEAFHVYARHPQRLRDLHALHGADTVHMAADYSVNLHLEKSAIPYAMPDDGLINRDYVDSNGNPLNVERIIPLLQQEQPEQPENGDSDEADSDPCDTGDSDSGSDSDEAGDSTGNSSGDNGDEAGSDSNSDEAGDDSSQDTGSNTPESCGELLPAPADMDDNELAQKAIKAVTLAKVGGHSLPDWMEHAVSDMSQNSETSWLDVLRDRFANAIDDSDYSFKRLNQKYLQIGMFVPTLYDDGIGKVAIVGDESSSMSDEQLNKVTEQTAAILNEWGPAETLIIRHTSQIVYTETLYKGQEPTPRKKRAHGGTDFMPVINLCEQENVEVIIWITDCYPCDNPRQSDVPVIWLGTDSSSAYAWKSFLGYGDYIDI